MSSIVRGQPNLHDSIESNSSNSSSKRKRKQEHDEDEQAAALLHHMHLMHPDNRPRVSDDPMHVDHLAIGVAAGDHHAPDREMLPHRPHGHGPGRQVARENSGSSDASATNYFSGDSDLTAEPIMGCAADEDGAKSSNSGSSTPVKDPNRAPPPTGPIEAPTAGGGQEYPIHPPPQHVESAHNDKENDAQMSPASAMMPSASTTSASMWSYKTFPDSKPFISCGHATGTMIEGCRRLQAEGADSGSASESWLELRLGFTAELQHHGTKNSDASIAARDVRRRSRELLDDVSESTPVTLQLLPGHSKLIEMSADAAAGVYSRQGTARAGSGLYGNLSPVYHPTAATFARTRPKFDENGHVIPRLVPPDYQQIQLQSQSKDPAAVALKPYDHQRFLLNQSNDPSADFQQSNQRSAVVTGYNAGIVYDQVREYIDSDDQRRWLATAETSDMMMMPAAAMIAASRPAEIYRPTASLGWHTGNADTRSWSSNSYTPPVQIQRSMSWQGLLRSMTTDTLLHPMPELPLSSFDTVTELSAMHGCRHMLPPASGNRRPSGHTTRANHQRLRLATPRRNGTGLWFSLQEAHHFSDENGEDREEQHSMQKVYLRIRDAKMQISVLQSYLIRKLESCGPHPYTTHEVEITCRGRTLAPTLTIQHVRDTIWLSKDFELNDTIGFRYTDSYLNDSHNRVMALCYQRHNIKNVTLNLLKT